MRYGIGSGMISRIVNEPDFKVAKMTKTSNKFKMWKVKTNNKWHTNEGSEINVDPLLNIYLFKYVPGDQTDGRFIPQKRYWLHYDYFF